jgi:hypothetical protein
MTQVAIQTQVDAIKKATEKATQSKEAALKFITEAGIEIKDDKVKPAIKEKK